MTRRGFVAALAALPFVGKLIRNLTFVPPSMKSGDWAFSPEFGAMVWRPIPKIVYRWRSS